MNKLLCLLILSFLFGNVSQVLGQSLIQDYQPRSKDSIRVGPGEKDFFPLIRKGYTLMLPKSEAIEGVLILLEDSGYDKMNNNAKQLYSLAMEHRFAVLSVSSEIPFDFYLDPSSIDATHELITEVFQQHQLPNQHVFFLGGSLVGHRALKYIEKIESGNSGFKLNVEGLVLCNFTMDWTRKWHQHQRDIRLARIDLWEPRFINYMLETHLGGTPETVPERYHSFSTYSYSDEKNDQLQWYSEYDILVYIEPEIHYRLKNYYRTLYENNTTDMVGFLAELELAGNDRTELVVLQPEDSTGEQKSSGSTWDRVDKERLMDWILNATRNTP